MFSRCSYRDFVSPSDSMSQVQVLYLLPLSDPWRGAGAFRTWQLVQVLGRGAGDSQCRHRPVRAASWEPTVARAPRSGRQERQFLSNSFPETSLPHHPIHPFRKFTTQCFLGHPELCTVTTIECRAFPSPPKKTRTCQQSHPLLNPAPSAPGNR